MNNGRWTCLPRGRGLLRAGALIFALGWLSLSARAESGWINYPTGPNFNPRAGTIECWIALGFDPEQFYPTEGYDNWISLLRVTSSPGVMGVSYVGGSHAAPKSGWTFTVGPQPPMQPVAIGGQADDWEEGNWHHLAVVWEGKQMRIYVDGEQRAEKQQIVTYASVTEVLTEVMLRVGAKNNKPVMIDEFRVSMIARDPKALEANQQGPLEPDPYTSILDRYDRLEHAREQGRTKPEVLLSGAGGRLNGQWHAVSGKFGGGIALYPRQDQDQAGGE